MAAIPRPVPQKDIIAIQIMPMALKKSPNMSINQPIVSFMIFYAKTMPLSIS